MSPPNLPEGEEALACIVRDADRAKGIVDRMRDGPSLPLMEVACGRRRTGLGARYFSSLYPQARRVHEFSLCGFPDLRAERRQRSRCSSSTGLLR